MWPSDPVAHITDVSLWPWNGVTSQYLERGHAGSVGGSWWGEGAGGQGSGHLELQWMNEGRIV